MENDEYDGEINELVLELLKLSTHSPPTLCCANTIPLLYMTADIPKDIEFYRRAVKINGMAIAWDLFNVRDREIILDAKKHLKGFRFLNCRWRNDEEITSRAILLHPENTFYTDYDCYNLRNKAVRKYT